MLIISPLRPITYIENEPGGTEPLDRRGNGAARSTTTWNLYAHRMAVLAHCQRRRYTHADDLYSANPQIECEPAKNRLVGILTIS